MTAHPAPVTKPLRGGLVLGGFASGKQGGPQAAGLSQEGMTHEAGLDRSYVGRIGRGEHNLAFVALIRLARAMRCDLAALIGGLPESRSLEP